MRQTRTTAKFTTWLDGLKDLSGRARTEARIQRLAMGNPGQHRVLKMGVSELEVDVGPGYRVYFTQRDEALVVLLCGGNKSSQAGDIKMAYEMVQGLED